MAAIDDSLVSPYTDPNAKTLDPSQMSEYTPTSPPPPPELSTIRDLFGEGAAHWVQQNIQDPAAYIGREWDRQLAQNPGAYNLSKGGQVAGSLGQRFVPMPTYDPGTYQEWQASAPPPEPKRGGLTGAIAAPVSALAGPLGPTMPGATILGSEAAELTRQAGGGPAAQAAAEVLGGGLYGGGKLAIERAALSPRSIARGLESDAGLPRGGAAIIPVNSGTTMQSIQDAWNGHLNTIMRGGTVDPQSLRYTTALLGARDEQDLVTRALTDPERLRTELPQVADHIGARAVGNITRNNTAGWPALNDAEKASIVPDPAHRAALNTITRGPGPGSELTGRLAAAGGAAALGSLARHVPVVGHLLTPELIELGAGALGFGGFRSNIGPTVARFAHDVAGGVPRSHLLAPPLYAAGGYENWQQDDKTNEPSK